MKKVLVPGIVAAFAMFAAGMAAGLLFNLIFPSVKIEYEKTTFFRSWDDPVMYIYFIQPFLICIALAWVWNKIRDRFSGSIAKMAFYYSFIYWIVAIIPGMIMTVSSFKISILMTFTWTISSLFQTWVASLIIIKLSK